MRWKVASGALALTLIVAPAPVRAQQPSAPARDSALVRDSANAPREGAGTRSDPCADPVYLQLRQIPLNAMTDQQRHDLDELDAACTEARLAAARRKISHTTAPYPGHVDYLNEVLPWVMGVAFFCSTVILLARTFQ